MIDRIRISCASLCRIEHAGRFFLLLNANRRARGLYILSPIGGALTLCDRTILDTFDATPETPGSDDLRLSLPVERLDAFREWFYSGAGRERSPFRELHEELVSEAGLLPALAAEDITIRPLWTVEEEDFTTRRGQTGLLTHYFLEIYDIILGAAPLAYLLTPPPESGAAWVTEAQITARETIRLHIDGAPREVQVNGGLLLSPPG
jgi:hypothetical protein